MSKRNSAPARVFAAAALIGGFLLVVVVVAGSIGDEDGGGSGSGEQPAATTGSGKQGGGGQKQREPRKSYVVQNGDTLTSIAAKTGVPVARIEALNPGVDPQILVSGEKLKLR